MASWTAAQESHKIRQGTRGGSFKNYVTTCCNSWSDLKFKKKLWYKNLTLSFLWRALSVVLFVTTKTINEFKKQLQKTNKKKLTGDLSLRNPFRSEPFPGVELPQVGAASIRPGHRARCGTQTHQHTEKHRQTHLWRCSPFSSHAENPRQFLD